MTAIDSDDPPHGPDFEVWNHLESGWQMAYDDIARKLSPEMLAFYAGMAELVVGLKSSLRVGVNDSALKARVASVFPSVSATESRALLTGLLRWVAEGSDPWLTHSVELELAKDGIGRATCALDRFRLLVPRLGSESIPNRALVYVREAVSAFLFGFDVACIALCRSVLEQVAREVLVSLGTYTHARLRREQPKLETLLNKLRQSGALDVSFHAAECIRRRANTVIHDHAFDEKVRRQVAMDSIADLTAVLREVVP